MINYTNRRPLNGAVASITGVGHGDVVGIFARCCHAVVTTRTRAQYRRVIDRHGRRPHDGIVAKFAGINRIHVRWRFSRR